MLDAFSPEANLFNADQELRRILLGRERKPIPFITILEFGLPLLVDAVPASRVESPHTQPET